MAKIYGIGETTMDLVIKGGRPVEFRPGGAVLNACVTLGRLGADIHIITSTGNDRLGKIVKAFLKENHVNLTFLTEFQGNTRLALAYLDKNNNADYSFYQDTGHTFRFQIPDFREGDILLHGSSFSLKEENQNLLRELISACRKNNVLIHYDPNFRSSYKKRLGEIIPRILFNIENAHIIKGSNDDFSEIFGTTDVWSTYKKIDLLGNKILVYTMGAKGVWLKTRDMEMFVESEKVTPVSTIGAGDTFNAGILYGLLRHGITTDNLHNIPEEIWKDILVRSSKFAANVCLSLDNYLPADYKDASMPI